MISFPYLDHWSCSSLTQLQSLKYLYLYKEEFGQQLEHDFMISNR